MRIAKPLLLLTTPIGVIGAIHEAFRLAGGLAFVLLLMVSMIGVAMCGLVLTIRKEQRLAKLRVEAQAGPEGVQS